MESALPPRVLVKLCTLLSEHAAAAYATGRGLEEGPDDDDDDEGPVPGGPLAGLTLRRAWLMHDRVLRSLDLGKCVVRGAGGGTHGGTGFQGCGRGRAVAARLRPCPRVQHAHSHACDADRCCRVHCTPRAHRCEPHELAAVLLSVNGMVACLCRAADLQRADWAQVEPQLPASVVARLQGGGSAEGDGEAEALEAQLAPRFWQLMDGVSGVTPKGVLAVAADGQAWDMDDMLLVIRQASGMEVAPEQVRGMG